MRNWRQFGANLAPMIGANWRLLAPPWRQLAPIIGANWRYRQLAMCTNQKFVLRSLIGANWRQLAPMAKLCKFSACFQKLTIANWRQLAPIGANGFRQLAPIGATDWRQLAPIGDGQFLKTRRLAAIFRDEG